MKSTSLFAGAAVAALLIAAPATAAPNLVTNGSFESGFSGWTLTGTAGDGDPAVVIPYNSTSGYPGGAYGEPIPPDSLAGPDPDAAGNSAVYFVSDFANETLTQTIHLDPGVYSIGFDAYAPGNGFANQFDATFTGSIAGVSLANYDVSTGPVQTWSPFYGSTKITTAGDYDITFTFNTNGDPAKDIVIDRVFVVAGGVPEPMTWAMLLVGFFGLGAVVRSARRKTYQMAGV
jgi:hypothetical protein